MSTPATRRTPVHEMDTDSGGIASSTSSSEFVTTPKGTVLSRTIFDIYCSVLQQALHDLNRRLHDKQNDSRPWFTLREDAQESETWPFSFRNVCDILGLDPKAVLDVAFRSLDGDDGGSCRSGAR